MDSPERRNKDVNDAATEVLGASQVTLNTPQGFEELYRNTFPRVYAYVASLLRDRSAAEDVTALAFERAYRKRSRFSARRGSPEAWVFGIARNAALDELRRLKRRARLESDPAEAIAAPRREAGRNACVHSQLEVGIRHRRVVAHGQDELLQLALLGVQRAGRPGRERGVDEDRGRLFVHDWQAFLSFSTAR
jgi:RNA polymerase sigma factor (sigma-70 family)